MSWVLCASACARQASAIPAGEEQREDESPRPPRCLAPPGVPGGERRPPDASARCTDSRSSRTARVMAPLEVHQLLAGPRGAIARSTARGRGEALAPSRRRQERRLREHSAKRAQLREQRAAPSTGSLAAAKSVGSTIVPLARWSARSTSAVRGSWSSAAASPTARRRSANRHALGFSSSLMVHLPRERSMTLRIARTAAPGVGREQRAPRRSGRLAPASATGQSPGCAPARAPSGPPGSRAGG